MVRLCEKDKGLFNLLEEHTKHAAPKLGVLFSRAEQEHVFKDLVIKIRRQRSLKPKIVRQPTMINLDSDQEVEVADNAPALFTSPEF